MVRARARAAAAWAGECPRVVLQLEKRGGGELVVGRMRVFRGSYKTHILVGWGTGGGIDWMGVKITRRMGERARSTSVGSCEC